MGKLVYTALTSLDGYVADAAGNFRWAEPEEDVHAFVNGLEASHGTLLLGRNMYGVMAFWEDLPPGEDYPAYIRDFEAAWKQARKIVVTRTLEAPTTARTELWRDLDPRRLAALKEAEARDLGIGGASLASSALGLGRKDFRNGAVVLHYGVST